MPSVGFKSLVLVVVTKSNTRREDNLPIRSQCQLWGSQVNLACGLSYFAPTSLTLHWDEVALFALISQVLLSPCCASALENLTAKCLWSNFKSNRPKSNQVGLSQISSWDWTLADRFDRLPALLSVTFHSVVFFFFLNIYIDILLCWVICHPPCKLNKSTIITGIKPVVTL